MEIVEKKNNPGAMGVLALTLLAAGAALLGWSLWMLPTAPAYGFPWAFTMAMAAFLPVAAGGWCLGAMVSRRRNPSYRYGSDGHEGSGGSIPFALYVIAAGVLLLCFNSGMLPYEWKRVFFSWQTLLIVLAMSEFARTHFTAGAVLAAVGGFFVVRRLTPLYPEIAASGVGENWWPILLIVAGVLILGGILFKPRHGGWAHANCGCGCGCGGSERDGLKLPNLNLDEAHRRRSKASGIIDINTVFGGSEQVYLDPEFRGGEINTVFGGVKLDLRRTELPEGETYLKVTSVFGGVEIDTPEEWVIDIRNESLFGGFYDKRLPALGKGYPDGRKLIIKASSVFGGGEIK
jgi:predicted membrane protein